MRYRITIRGISPLITHNGAEGLNTGSAWAIEAKEITAKGTRTRTADDERRLQELDCLRSLYLDPESRPEGRPTFPEAVLRSNIEAAARKYKEGPAVREGLVVEQVEEFYYDHQKLGKTARKLGRSAQFTVPVVVSRARILRTRAKFDEWGITFRIDTDPELVDEERLERWLDVGGHRLGLGDWRPQKSGHYGRYKVESITPIDETTETR